MNQNWRKNDFCSLSEVRDNLKPQWYRSKMTPEAFELFLREVIIRVSFKPADILACFVLQAFHLFFCGSIATGLLFASLSLFMEQFLHFLRGRLFMNLGMARSLRQNGSISFFTLVQPHQLVEPF